MMLKVCRPTEQLRRWTVARQWYAKPAAAMGQLSRASQANAEMRLASNESIGGRIAPASLRDNCSLAGLRVMSFVPLRRWVWLR